MHPGVFAARSRSRRRSSWGAAGTVVTYAEGAGAGAGPLADRLASYCREHPAGFKCPRSYEFTTGNCGHLWARSAAVPERAIRRGPGLFSSDI